ncbi:ribonuclease 2-like isoform X2 [Amaranthus tricolor]|uniref:ribonuclease 2-like isoform X2 n=1 Tax=Amaranthus tricolor TaxID=29722 RepID=UPI0025895345|nr:ribonuclease 2-like isoform X2 [Amaranthus tricolor]
MTTLHTPNSYTFFVNLTIPTSMAFLLVGILLHILLASIVPSTISFNGVDDGLLKYREFDYFVLALQWPGTYCRNTHKCCKSNGCCRSNGPARYFTIHGLWPDYNDGSWPSCCTKSDFDMNEISTLCNALDKYWPSLSCGSSSTCHGQKGSFWAHEVEMHGTCASPVIRDEYNFFLTTLNVYFKHNITEVLSEAGYVPSNSEKYPLGGITSAIENAFHQSPLVVCSGDAIEEVHLCFYKDFKPRDCAPYRAIKEKVDFSKPSCPKYVSLPVYNSLGSNQVWLQGCVFGSSGLF